MLAEKLKYTNQVLQRRKITLHQKTTQVYWYNKIALRQGYKLFINQGGTYSSKTWSILQLLIDIAIENPKWIITVTAQDFPNLRRGALRMFREIISDQTIGNFFVNTKLNEGPYVLKNGSIIEFACFETMQDAQSGKRQVIFFNECNGILQDIVDVLMKKTDFLTFMDYNPTSQFYVHDDYMHKPGAKVIITTFMDNQFITENKRNELFALYDEYVKNPSTYNYNQWRVYGQGKTGIVDGLCIPQWRTISEFPHEQHLKQFKYMGLERKICYGMDFGYRSSPNTIIKTGIRQSDGRICAQQIYYDHHFNSFDMYLLLPELGITKNDIIIADPSHLEVINILQRHGYKVFEASKPDGSVKAGIQLVNKLGLDVTFDSEDLKRELKSYEFMKKFGGRYDPDKPKKGNDHLIDPLRYDAMVMTTGLGIKNPKRQGGRRRGRVIAAA